MANTQDDDFLNSLGNSLENIKENNKTENNNFEINDDFDLESMLDIEDSVNENSEKSIFDDLLEDNLENDNEINELENLEKSLLNEDFEEKTTEEFTNKNNIEDENLEEEITEIDEIDNINDNNIEDNSIEDDIDINDIIEDNDEDLDEILNYKKDDEDVEEIENSEINTENNIKNDIPIEMQNMEELLFGNIISARESNYDTYDEDVDETIEEKYLEEEIEKQKEKSFTEEFGLEGDVDLFSLEGFGLENDEDSLLEDFDTGLDSDGSTLKIPSNILEIEKSSMDDDFLDDELPEGEEKETFETAFGDGPKKKKKKKHLTYEISDEDLDKILTYLNKFPRNVKIEIQDFLADENIAQEDFIELVEMLIAGKPIKKIVKWLSEKLDKLIKVPKGFEALTGEDFENNINTPMYIFKEKILPMVTKVAIISILVGFSIWGIFWNLLPPARANRIYNKGYKLIEAEKYDSSMIYFDKATKIYPLRKKFYKYADGYIEKRQYVLAEKTYDKLLAIQNFPNDDKGRLKYGKFESELLGNYEKADNIMQPVLENYRINKQGLIETGKNYLRWGDYEPEKYELARKNFAEAIENYGASDELIFQMLHYCIKTDKYKEIEEIKELYQNGKKRKKKIDKYVYCKMADYYINRNETEDVYKILERVKKQDSKYPNTYFEYARYFKLKNNINNMEKATDKVLFYLKNEKLITNEKISMKILSEAIKGEALYSKGNLIAAENRFQAAINLYEDSLSRKILRREKNFGEIYKNMGDIFYYDANDLDIAYIQYSKAEKNFYETPSMNYKKGYIDYKRKRYEQALIEFSQSAQQFSSNINLMYATANTMYNRGDYFSAIGNYYHLIDILEAKKETIKGFDPKTRPNHKYIVDDLVKTYNNLGVAQYKAFRESGRQSQYLKSLAYLQKSTEYRDALTRNRKTLIAKNLKASEAKSNMREVMAGDNINSILYPKENSGLLIFEEIPIDLTDNSLGYQILGVEK